VLSPVARLLKQQTASMHAQVEARLGLLDPGLSSARLRAVLACFAGVWQGVERGVDDWAVVHAAMATALNWSRRRRGAVLRSDLLRLGMSVGELAELPEVAPPFRTSTPTDAEVLGWLYVSEGATLGGAVISRALRAQPGRAMTGLRTFAPYPEGPGPMWRAYLDQLQHWVGDDDDRRDAVVEAARGSFSALADRLAPIAAEVPA
jgi:heme oxygenase (biliverdin-IX-beta and delta-forming)